MTKCEICGMAEVVENYNYCKDCWEFLQDVNEEVNGFDFEEHREFIEESDVEDFGVLQEEEDLLFNR